MGDKNELLEAIWHEEYAVQYDARYQHPTATCSHEYGNEIAHRTATKLADDLIEELKGKGVDELRAYLQSYEDGRD